VFYPPLSRIVYPEQIKRVEDLGGKPTEEIIARLPFRELLDLGVLPPIVGLYAWDEAAFDAVLVSHAHIDQ
jgi:hypothetical protein